MVSFDDLFVCRQTGIDMARLSFVLALLALVLAIVALVQYSSSVTSVGLVLPRSVFGVTGSPVTSVGTLTGTFNDQNVNTVFAGPSAGVAAAPSFRALALSDFPADLSYVQAFGAKCDGKTNDTAALLKADANSTGGIAVPPGTCVIAASITLQHQLVMSPGAMLSIAPGATLTLLIVPIASAQQQIF